MAMRRLSIIDLEGGWQPLYNEDHTIALIANGEIYNFIELRKTLEARGHRFQTGSDCESILHLYEDYGDECVKYLRGMFAFAIWDTKKQRLILARDRMGEKPLYLFESGESLIFSSEIRSLLSSGQIPFELDPASVNQYFYYQYIPEPLTPINNVVKLEAAHILTLDVNDWQIKKKRYWDIMDVEPIYGDAPQLIRNELEKISELIIRADVPVGVALSGGLDSSAVAALATKKYPGTIHAFSVGYPGYPPNDERPAAKEFADYLDIPFHDIELTTEYMVDFFPELVYQRDDPIADISGYGYYAVMKLARNHNVPVILQGQGGDELFWGYQWMRDAVRESMIKSAIAGPEQVRLIDYIDPQAPKDISVKGLYRWAKSLAGIRNSMACYDYLKHSPPDRLVFYDKTPDFQDAEQETKHLYSKSFIKSIEGHDPYQPFTVQRPWQRVDMLLTDLICKTYLVENGITQGDRLSMASSVELRLPLLDYRLVEIVMGLRKANPDYQLPPKALFKAALKDVLPEWVIKRPKKGFAPPTKEWFDALTCKYGSLVKDGFLVRANIISQRGARSLSDGRYPPGVIMPMSFKAQVLEIWCRELTNKLKLKTEWS
jgi:asparagine synthase (glutamine-hydrolysing)